MLFDSQSTYLRASFAFVHVQAMMSGEFKLSCPNLLGDWPAVVGFFVELSRVTA